MGRWVEYFSLAAQSREQRLFRVAYCSTRQLRSLRGDSREIREPPVDHEADMIKRLVDSAFLAFLSLALVKGACAQTIPADALQQLMAKIETLEKRVAELEAQQLRTGVPAGAAVASGDIAAQMESLDQAIRIAERKRELDAEAAALVASTAPVVGADGNGFMIKSA